MATPLVSVVVAARNAERTLDQAVRSVLSQSLRDLELVVVDDGSVDGSASVLQALDDPRLRVVRNPEPLGLAGALNVGFDAAQGSLLARMDADDVALPGWLERIVARIQAAPLVAVVGSGMIDLHSDGRLGTVHRMPTGARAVRWAALFSSPFFHSTLVVDRAVLDAHGLRYDPTFGESEDYDLWARLLAVADGDNRPEALVLYRKHEAQASARRAMLQRECQRQVAMRQLGELVPDLSREQAELAWLLGAGLQLPEGAAAAAAEGLARLVEAFEARYDGREARRLAAWSMVRAHAAAPERLALRRAALRLDPTLPMQAAGRLRRRRASRPAIATAQRWLVTHADDGPVRLTIVLPEPTPYRNPMLDSLSKRPELDLTALYVGGSQQRRAFDLELDHRAVAIKGVSVPGARRLFRHDYPVAPGTLAALRTSRPEVVVVSGWSTFGSQAAIAWCRRRRVPYILLVESHDQGSRAGWRRAVKGAVAPRVIRGAAHVLVVGSLARQSVTARGADPLRVDVFANTIDVAALAERTDRLRERRAELRAEVGLGADDVAVLCVARLSPEKGLDTLVRAVGATDDSRLVLLLAGSGPQHDALAALARADAVRLVLLPEVPWERIAERYAAADVFALLSTRETWGVVVNEALAAGLPVVLSDGVGAAADLLEEGRNGILVPAGDVDAAAHALRTLADDPQLRRAMGARSRELIADWGYESSVETLVRVACRVAGRA